MGGSAFTTAGVHRAARARGRRPAWLGWLALLAFALRALVPLGFEPGAHGLSIQLCHEGFPSGFFAHGGAHRSAHGEPDGAGSARHCLFCNGTSPAPVYALVHRSPRAPFAIGLPALQPAVCPGRHGAHIPQARAPPAFA